MRLWKGRAKVERLVLEHLAQVREAVGFFGQATRAHFVDRDTDKAELFALETHKAEGRADDTRRDVEKSLISGALLAPARRRILELVERVDSLANAAESSLDYLLVQRVKVPEELVEGLIDILDETLEIFEDVERSIHLLFTGPREKTLECTARIEKREGKIDHIERKLTKRLFELDLDLAAKLHVHGYISELVTISDRAEDLADRIALVIAEQAI